MDDTRVEQGDSGRREPGRTPGRSRYVLLPAATFLVGLLLGGALVWVAQPGEEGGGSAEGQPSPSAGVTPTPTTVPSGSIVVPRACLQAVEAAQEVVDLARDAVTAIGDLDAAALQKVVNRIEKLDRRVRADIDACRQPEAP